MMQTQDVSARREMEFTRELPRVASDLSREVASDRKGKRALKAQTIAIEDLQPLDVLRMHSLFCQYYDDHPIERFKADLAEKDHVIVMRDRESRTIQGFSTLLQVWIESDGRKYLGLYSGDTVVAKEYWGSSALGSAFMAYYWKMRFANWMRPVYWFLISKGYKTYLLMANNFEFHYPRHEEATPAEMRKLMNAFYGPRFEAEYDSARSLIVPSHQSCRLKGEIAPITTEQLAHPRIAFFQKSNPRWRQGSELACVAKMNVLTPFKFFAKKMLRGFAGGKKSKMVGRKK